jgi:hypothetical protein
MTELEYALTRTGVDINKINTITAVGAPKLYANIIAAPHICIDDMINCIDVKSYVDLANKQDRAFVAEKVIFHDPATIVYWGDGTKTVVKCSDSDTFNPITGVALCYMKKALGNKARTFNDALREAGV